MRIRALSVFEGVVYHCYAPDISSPCRPTLEVEAITRDKQMRLRRLAARWIDDADFRPVEIRFDVASVMDGAVDVLEGAF